MDSQLKTKEDVLGFLSNTGLEFEVVDHDPVPTVATMLEKVNFGKETLLAKNLFIKDKKNKDQFYLVVAKHDTNADFKLLAKHLKTSASNLRGGEEEQMFQTLGVKPGSVNLFSIINDSEEKVKLILDKKVKDAAHVGVHPMVNTSTVRVCSELVDHVIEYSSHEADIVDFEELAAQVAKDEEQKTK